MGGRREPEEVGRGRLGRVGRGGEGGGGGGGDWVAEEWRIVVHPTRLGSTRLGLARLGSALYHSFCLA